MSRHNYTNPAFCQQSEFYPTPSASSPSKVHRSESIHSFRQLRSNSTITRQNSSVRETPPKPGPKPQINISARYAEDARTDTRRYEKPSCIQTISGCTNDGYALVPVSELPKHSKNRYAFVPAEDSHLVRTSSRLFTKSQDHIDGNVSIHSSLPSPISKDEPTSLILVDQKNMQKYAMIPTEDDEELVDDNQEIIQMHNGRAHRYAIIPTDDDEETCLSNELDLNALNNNYATIKENVTPAKTPQKLYSASPHKPNYQITSRTPTASTPKKNTLLATQKLHEILSTPKKTPQLHCQDSSIRNSSRRYQSQILTSSTAKPYDLSSQIQHIQNPVAYEQRTTAVISPRLASLAAYSEDSTNRTSKSWNSLSFQKVANATATIGAVSLMLIICGAMNSGLCLYMVANFGRIYYLDIGVISGFASIALGILGFRSRQCDWLPNRNYISVTVFSLLNCCGLLILIGLRPIPGTPIHDVTTGVVLGLSSLILLIISLGVITSRWCRAPPPDNRVDVY